MTPNKTLPWLLPGSSQEPSTSQRAIRGAKKKKRQWGGPSDRVRDMSPCLGTPRAVPGQPQPHGLSGHPAGGSMGRVTSQTKRGHRCGGMGNIMGWRKREFWGFHKASYGMFRGESSDRERNRSTWFGKDLELENRGIRGLKDVSMLHDSHSVCVFVVCTGFCTSTRCETVALRAHLLRWQQLGRLRSRGLGSTPHTCISI